MPEKPPIQELRADQCHHADISDEQYFLIGRIIVEWSKLEATMEDTIWMFLDIDEDDGKAITKRLGADGKLQLLRTLGARYILVDELRAPFVKLLQYVDELKEGRNFIAHGTRGTLMPDNVPVALSLKSKADPGEVISETFPKERMDAIYDSILLAKRKLIDLPELLGKPRRVPREPPRP